MNSTTHTTPAVLVEQSPFDYGTDEIDVYGIVNMLTDARHWCDHNRQCFATLDRHAYQQYLIELSEERRNDGGRI